MKPAQPSSMSQIFCAAFAATLDEIAHHILPQVLWKNMLNSDAHGFLEILNKVKVRKGNRPNKTLPNPGGAR